VTTLAWLLIQVGETKVTFSWGLVFLVLVLAPSGYRYGSFTFKRDRKQ